MKKSVLEPDKGCLVIDFQNHKLKGIAREYVRHLADYGVEAASLWSMDKVNDENERRLFNKFVRTELRKYGFSVRTD